MAERRLVLVAGAGALVPRAIAAAREAGWTVRVMTLGERPELAHENPFVMRINRPDLALREVKRFGATAVCAVGGVHLSDQDREGLAAFVDQDAPAEKRQSRGDSALTMLGNKLLDILGIPFIGVHQIVSGLLAEQGWMAGPEPDPLLARTLQFAFEAARKAGSLDLGQGLVVSGARIVALEDIGGTDDLLARVAHLRQRGLIGGGDSRLVLGKTSKPGQPTHTDLPAIGPATIAGASAAGISGIALEADKVLLVEREALLAAANAAGITVFGYVARRDG